MAHPNHPPTGTNLAPIHQRRHTATHTDNRPECWLCHQPIDCKPTRMPLVAAPDGTPIYTAPVHPLCAAAQQKRARQ